jgi:hypothetical protein
MKTLGLQEIERIFAVVEPLGISREAVFIPLKAMHPGEVKLRTDGRMEIVLDSESDFEEWLADLPARVRGLLESDAAEILRRD